jgi:hydrogenase/urease accessory protein HupE
MRNARYGLALGWALALAGIARFAHAHAVGLSSGEYAVNGSVVAARLVFAQADAAGLDARVLLRGIVVSSDGKPCAGAIDEIGAAQPAGTAYKARFICDPPRQRIEVRAAFFDRLPEGHRHAIRLQQGPRSVEDILYRRHDTLTLAADDGPSRGTPSAVAGMGGLLRMGLEHILTGYDHLLFLLGLVLVGGRLRSILAVVTAFTVAHSITLGAAALGVWVPPAGIVEPAIAASIAYVGVENLFVRDARGRWRVTFPFGLVHGFGFAGALRSAAIPQSQLPAALFSFNLGVEVGQLAVLSVVLPALACLRRSRRFAGVSRALSAAVIAAGAIWFVIRIAHART